MTARFLRRNAGVLDLLHTARRLREGMDPTPKLTTHPALVHKRRVKPRRALLTENLLRRFEALLISEGLPPVKCQRATQILAPVLAAIAEGEDISGRVGEGRANRKETMLAPPNRLLWDDREGSVRELSPPEFIALAYAAEIRDGTLTQALVRREQLRLYAAFHQWRHWNRNQRIGFHFPTQSEATEALYRRQYGEEGLALLQASRQMTRTRMQRSRGSKRAEQTEIDGEGGKAEGRPAVRNVGKLVPRREQ